MKRKDSERAPLMDRFHAWTFGEKCQGVRVSEKTMAVQRTFRAKLKAAQRMVLDDDAVRLICHLSHELDRLPAWSFLARIPFDPVWIECSLHTKCQEFATMGKLKLPFNPEQVAKNVGYLIWRDEGEESPRWVGHGVVDGEEGNDSSPAMPELIGYVFDPEGDAKWPVKGSKFWRSPTLSMRPHFPRMPVVVKDDKGSEIRGEADPELILGGVFGAAKSLSDDGTSRRKVRLDVMKEGEGKFRHLGDNLIEGPNWLVPRMAAIVNPWWDAHMPVGAKENRQAHHLLINQVRENAGHLRWIVTMLAAYNGLPRESRARTPRTSRMSVGAHTLPYFHSSTVTVTIPRENRVLISTKTLDKALRNADPRKLARHRRSGHWRVIERGKATYMCRHSPVEMEPNVGICEKCGLIVRYINDYWAGDSTVGVVTQTYEVKT